MSTIVLQQFTITNIAYETTYKSITDRSYLLSLVPPRTSRHILLFILKGGKVLTPVINRIGSERGFKQQPLPLKVFLHARGEHKVKMNSFVAPMTVYVAALSSLFFSAHAAKGIKQRGPSHTHTHTHAYTHRVLFQISCQLLRQAQLEN